MSFIKKSASAFSKLLVVTALAATFAFGLIGVVFMSLQGNEIKVPEIVGKDLAASEKELADLGLKIKRRADRYSNEKPNTILEQLPKAGDTVKTGQMILVVTSKTNPEGEEAPATIKKSTDEDDTEKIEELISDKPKKSNKTNTGVNSNKKKTSTTRDVIGNSSDDSNSSNSNSDSKNSNDNSSKDNKNTANDSNKTANPAETKKPNTETKPTPAKTPVKPAATGDLKPKKTP